MITANSRLGPRRDLRRRHGRRGGCASKASTPRPVRTNRNRLTTSGSTDEQPTPVAMAGTLRAVPNIDDGSAEGAPGRPLKHACVTLGIEEAHELLGAL